LEVCEWYCIVARKVYRIVKSNSDSVITDTTAKGEWQAFAADLALATIVAIFAVANFATVAAMSAMNFARARRYRYLTENTCAVKNDASKREIIALPVVD
jgi:hypothetical protein